jgi:DNA replication and repair protein RecR
MALQHYSSRLLENAVNEFARLPGIGRKTALRLVLHLLRQESESVISFSESIRQVRHDIKYCRSCNNISDTDVCEICADARRDHSTICVVESIRDVMAIENTRQYSGIYHVLGGVISPMDGIGPDDLNIATLEAKIKEGKAKEIILALSTTMEGDTTNFLSLQAFFVLHRAHHHHCPWYFGWRRTGICRRSNLRPFIGKPASI